MSASARRSEGGVALVEAAFALPILFLFVAGLVDLGMWAYNSNQAANAARDGARLAILDYETADITGSSSHQAIVAAIEAHLPGRTLDPADVHVSCVDSDGGGVAGGCAAADPDRDRIRVEVGWTWDLVTPIAGVIGVDAGAADGTATMAILGLPLPDTNPVVTVPSTGPAPTVPTTIPSTTTTTSTTPTAPTVPSTAPPSTVPASTTTAPPPTTTTTTTPALCVVSGVTVSPSPVGAKNSGALQSDLDVSFQATGVGCVALSVQIVAPDGGSHTQLCGCGFGTSRSFTYGKNSDRFWSAGIATVRVFNGPSVLGTTTFTVT